MTIAHIVGGATRGSGALPPVTVTVDSTGADFGIVHVASYDAGGSPVVTDNLGNTWTLLVQQDTAQPGSDAELSSLYYCGSPTVGIGHAITASAAILAGSIAVDFFSGVKTTSFVDSSGGATVSPGTVLPLGTITPSVNGALIYTGLSTNDGVNNATIDAGFVTPQGVQTDPGNNFGCWTSYLIQGTTTPVAPSWTSAAATGVTGTYAVILSSVLPPVAGPGRFMGMEMGLRLS